MKTSEPVLDVVRLGIEKRTVMLLRRLSAMVKKLALSVERKAIRSKTVLKVTKTKLEIEIVSNVERKVTGDMNALKVWLMVLVLESFLVSNVDRLVIVK